MKPYKLSWYLPGAYHVIDRATGQRCGWVLAAYYGWEGHVEDPPNYMSWPDWEQYRLRSRTADVVYERWLSLRESGATLTTGYARSTSTARLSAISR